MKIARHLGVVLGVAGLLAVAACGSESADPGALAGPEPSLEPLESSQRGGFDECGLVSPDDLAAILGVDALHITSRDVDPEAEGGRLAGCSYFTEHVPGVVGMSINTVTGTDREQFFAPFRDIQVSPQSNFGDYAELTAYTYGPVHFRELRVIEGTTGLHIKYTYNDSPGGMPDLENERLAAVLGGTVLSALETLPGDVDIADGGPEGPCADIDVAQASDVLGDDLIASRSLLGSGGAMSCQFAGADASLGVVVITDPGRVQSMRASDGDITESDIGDGAQVQIQDEGAGLVNQDYDELQGPLDATVNLDDRLVLVVGVYGDGAGTVTTPRPEDIDLVRSIAAAVA